MGGRVLEFGHTARALVALAHSKPAAWSAAPQYRCMQVRSAVTSIRPPHITPSSGHAHCRAVPTKKTTGAQLQQGTCRAVQFGPERPATARVAVGTGDVAVGADLALGSALHAGLLRHHRAWAWPLQLECGCASPAPMPIAPTGRANGRSW